MGLSASQARFLTLTAKKSDLEYETQQISHDRIKLSESTKEIEEKYTQRVNNTILKFKNSDSSKYTVLTYDAFKNNDVFSQLYLTNSSGKIVVASSDDIPKGANSNDYYIDENLENNAHFESSIKDGVYFITEKDSTTGENKQRGVADISFVVEDYDDSDDDAAKAEYDLEMKKIQRQDKKLELELDRIETSHKAIETEMETVSKVIDQNIENSFKTFS